MVFVDETQHELFYFRYMTVREQKLQDRRRCAEELLAWKRKLDEEEEKVERLEMEAMAILKQRNSEKIGKMKR